MWRRASVENWYEQLWWRVTRAQQKFKMKLLDDKKKSFQWARMRNKKKYIKFQDTLHHARSHTVTKMWHWRKNLLITFVNQRLWQKYLFLQQLYFDENEVIFNDLTILNGIFFKKKTMNERISIIFWSEKNHLIELFKFWNKFYRCGSLIDIKFQILEFYVKFMQTWQK